MPSRWVSATRARPAGGVGAGDGSGVTAGADGVGSTVGVTDAMAGKADVLASTTLVDGSGLDEAGAVQPMPIRARTAANAIGRRAIVMWPPPPAWTRWTYRRSDV